MIVHDPVTRIGMPMDEFIRQFDEQPFELINGERRLLMPPLPRHGVLVAFLYKLLDALKKTASIEVFFELPFVLVETSDWVKGSRVPDVLIYDETRFSEYKSSNPDWLDKPFVIVPDLCIEVVSKNDLMQDVTDKVEAYLRDGVKMVWVIEPWTRTITVRELGSQHATILYPHDTLTGGAVVPGLSVRVSEVFGETA